MYDLVFYKRITLKDLLDKMKSDWMYNQDLFEAGRDFIDFQIEDGMSLSDYIMSDHPDGTPIYFQFDLKKVIDDGE